jgi:NAD(P)-dependent dehydrogenase (short-subunit alcohol dehydrogenase family)
MARWNDKVAVITGAASGIGRALAEVLAAEGCRLALSDVNEAGLAETKDLVEKAGAQAHTHKVNVAKREQVEGWADAIVAEYGGVDIVINNAGVTVVDTFEDISYEDFEWIVSINFWGAVYGSKTFLPHLRKAKEGYLGNVSSIWGMLAAPSQSAYCATKYAVRGFTESLRQEMHGTNVTVTCIHPGAIKTAITANARHHHRPGRTFSREQLINEFEPKVARTTAQQAATIIVKGMQAKKRRVFVGTDAHALNLMQRMLPLGYEGILRRQLNIAGH